MSDIGYKNARLEDLSDVVKVLNQSRHELPHERDLAPAEVKADLFDDEDFDPAGCWLARQDGKPLGIGRAIVERRRQELGLRDGFAMVEVVPEARGKGIEQELVRRILGYFRSKDLALAQFQVPTEQGWRNDLALGSGFMEVRRFYRMELKALTPIKRVVPPRGVSVQAASFKEADDKTVIEFSDVFNETFSDHFNFSPISSTKWIRMRDSFQDIGRMMFAKYSDETVGVLFAEESAEFNRINNTRVGWIWILGVKKDLRKRGIGLYLLTEGVNWLLNRGMQTVLLGVDAENRGALGLYTSAGFEVLSESVVYRLKLKDAGSETREAKK